MCDIKILTQYPEALSIIEKNWKVQRFQRKCSIFYKGQVPNIAIGLVEGAAAIFSNGENFFLGPGTLIGLRELFYFNPARNTLILDKDSQAYIFDRDSFCVALADYPLLSPLLDIEGMDGTG